MFLVSKRRWLLAAALLAASCAKDELPGDHDGGVSTSDAGVDARTNPEDGGVPPGEGGRGFRLDRPGDLERPPAGELPDDLLPPGFSR